MCLKSYVYLILSIVFSLGSFVFSSEGFAQSLNGGNFTTSFDSTSRRYFDQQRVTTPSSAAMCAGANNHVRYYLSSDHNNNGLPDYKVNYRLRDNFWTTGPANAVKLALITVRDGASQGTKVSYYSPTTNILSVFNNGISYPIDSNRVWYRQSNIAPKDVYVRAVESQSILFEIPTSRNPVDAKFQIGYNVRFRDYDSIKPSGNSTYVAYKIPGPSYAGPVLAADAWHLNTLTPSFDTFYGPNWPANYTNGTSFTTRSIQWQETEKTHALECFNGYLSRCGDGYIDASGQQPWKPSGTQPHTISDAGVNEQCDPGSNLNSWTDDVMPGGVPATATYNCTATCTINGNPANSPVLTIDKQQKLMTGMTVFSGVGLGTPSNIGYTSPSRFEFKIIITNNGGDATNVVMRDTLPVGFVVDTLPGGCSGLRGSTVIACNAPNGGMITSVPFNLPAGQSATFTIVGTLTSTVPTVNSANATYTDPTDGSTETTPTDSVNQYPQTPINPPVLTIDKQQKLMTGMTAFSGVGLGTPSNIGYTSPSRFEFKIIITNNGGDATNVVMRDTLPVGFVVDTLPGGCSGLRGSTVIACNAPNGGMITSVPFNLPAGQSATFTIVGTLTSTVPTVNSANATYTDPTDGSTETTPTDVVQQHPQTHIAPSIRYTKTVRNVTTNSNGGSFIEADNLATAVEVHTGDIVEYEITIQLLTGTVVNTVLTDVLPTNNGFVMTGYSINNAPTVVATSFPSTNITALLNTNTVVVKLYGYVGNPTATQFVNTALLTENGSPAQTFTPGSNVAWTKLPAIVANPRLYLQKYWINPNNPNQTGDYYVVPANTPIKFILRVTNIGNVSATGIIYDACPINLNCISYRILPSSFSVSYAPTIPVGSIPVGGYVEVEVSAIAYPNGGTNTIRNLAQLYRVCDNAPTNLGCFENEDDATLDPLPINLCQNGILDPGEQCDFGPNMPQVIGNYLDLTFSHPSVTSSYNHRGKICNTSCQIVHTNLNRCGDGILGKLEQCDMGSNNGIVGNITNYLDTTTNHPSGIYNGATCSTSCTLQGDNQPEMPACWYGDTIISVMKDEYFPFSWDIELPEEDFANSCANDTDDGKILRNSLTCDFRVYNRNGEITGPEWLRNIPCYTNTWGNSPLFEQFRIATDGERDPLFVKNPVGTYYINPTEFRNIVGNELGEYKLSLNAVNYQYCSNGQAVSGNPYARVCQVNFAVTDHYLMQKGSVSTKTNADLSDYFLLNGDSLYKATDLNKIDQLTSLNYANLSARLNILTNNLVAKYEKIAVNATVGGVTAKKVPGQAIYIMEGGKTFRGVSLATATTIIVKGDVTVVGNINKNTLLIATGKVKFDLPQPGDDDRRNGCNPQTIRGIIVAQGGFIASSNNGFKNNNLNRPRCRKGNLMVYGALVGNNLETVESSRRSHLEHWFTFNQNGAVLVGGSNGDSRVKAERREEVYQGASVYIEQNPSLWRDVPPGADEFLRTLNISRN